MNDNPKYVSQAQYEELNRQNEIHKERIDSLYEENEQLKQALGKLNMGIHKASERVQEMEFTKEGQIRLSDRQLITNLAFDLVKHHPSSLIIKYKDDYVIEVKPE